MMRNKSLFSYLIKNYFRLYRIENVFENKMTIKKGFKVKKVLKC